MVRDAGLFIAPTLSLEKCGQTVYFRLAFKKVFYLKSGGSLGLEGGGGVWGGLY